MNTLDIRQQFPIFDHYPDLVYLDNAATTHKPREVIDSITRFYQEHNANIHRGLYPLSEQATSLYEQARQTVADFIGAKPQEVIFTSGTTDGLNGIVSSLVASDLLHQSPKVLLSELEHHANILPWQKIPHVELDYLKMGNDFTLTTEMTDSSQYDAISICQMSNVTGTINDVSSIFQDFDGLKIVDAAQSIAHMPTDVTKLGVDIMAFSGHKLYGPTGVGVLFIREELQAQLPPFRVGGGMIREVTKTSATWANGPQKFEAGTPPIAQAIGLASAIEFVNKIGWESITAYESNLTAYLVDQLTARSDIQLLSSGQSGVVSFNIQGVHPHDLSDILGTQSVCTRAGHHCCQILHRELGLGASLRASLGIYNQNSDIDKMMAGIDLAVNRLRK